MRQSGLPIGTVDILIASMCINRNLELLTKDTDFKSVKEVEPNFRLRFKS